MVDYCKPQLFVEIVDGKRAVLNVFDEALDDFALAESLPFGGFQFIDPLRGFAVSFKVGVEQYKIQIKEHIEREHGYDLSKTLNEIRPTYRFNESCQDTVPQAIIAFLESADFEDAIRNAISLGGDSDTLAAITGSIAEAAYGIPDAIKDKAMSFLDEPLCEVYERWATYIMNR